MTGSPDVLVYPRAAWVEKQIWVSLLRIDFILSQFSGVL